MITRRTYLMVVGLMLVFSMNTFISSACYLSSVFHNAHHRAMETSHHHGDEEKTHNHAAHKHSHADSEEPSSKDECCSGDVTAFEKLDKSAAKSIQLSTVVFFSEVVVPAYYKALTSSIHLSQKKIIHQVRWRLLATIPDLRIVMQSFQI